MFWFELKFLKKIFPDIFKSLIISCAVCALHANLNKGSSLFPVINSFDICSQAPFKFGPLSVQIPMTKIFFSESSEITFSIFFFQKFF